MIGVPARVHVYLACGATDMRKGFDGLSALVQTMLKLDPHGGALFVFRGKRGDLIKVLWWDGQGLCLFAKRLERGRFIWPQAKDGSVTITNAQLSMLLEGIDWRAPLRTWLPRDDQGERAATIWMRIVGGGAAKRGGRSPQRVAGPPLTTARS